MDKGHPNKNVIVTISADLQPKLEKIKYEKFKDSSAAEMLRVLIQCGLNEIEFGFRKSTMENKKNEKTK